MMYEETRAELSAPPSLARDIDVEPQQRDLMYTGAAAGLVGAVLMALFLMLAAATRGDGFFHPLYVIGASYVRHGTGALPAGVAVLGLVMHLIVGMTLGMVYAALMPKFFSRGAVVKGAFIFGLVTFFVMVYTVLPNFARALDHDLHYFSWLVAHLFFALGLALVVGPTRRPSLTNDYEGVIK